MGTRSVTRIFSEMNHPLCAIYHQYDGYFSGVGLRLARFLDGLAVINGMTGDDGRAANGMGCLAVQLIAHLKQERPEMGSLYMTSNDDSQQYGYEIRFPEGADYFTWSRPKHRWTPILVGRGGEEEFRGTAAEWIARFGNEGHQHG